MKALTTPFAAAAVAILLMQAGCSSSEEKASGRPSKPAANPASQTQVQLFEGGSSAPSNPGAARPGRPSDPVASGVEGTRYQTRDLSQVEYATPAPPADAAAPGTPAAKGPGASHMMDRYVPSSGAPAAGRVKARPGGKAGASTAAVLDRNITAPRLSHPVQ